MTPSQTARNAAIFTGAVAACMVSLAFSSCAADHAEPTATAAIPADWTENPLAGVVYEPIGQEP